MRCHARISSATWWLMERLANTLGADEREAVLGDMAESDVGCGRILREIFGLVVRRQAALWNDWRPWAVFGGAAVPLGMLLAFASRDSADGGAICLWLSANNWDRYLLRSPGFWRLVMEWIPGVALLYLALACWSWTSGLLLGLQARRTVLGNGFIFCIMLLFGELLAGHSLLFGQARDYGENEAVFANVFYRAWFPLIVLLAFVVVPAVWGMREGLRAARLPRFLRAMVWSFALVAMMTLPGHEASLLWLEMPAKMRLPLLPLLQALSLAPWWLLGPMGFLATTEGWRWRQRREGNGFATL
jgi:hypothetical protein